jgi:hypothetical protein
MNNIVLYGCFKIAACYKCTLQTSAALCCWIGRLAQDVQPAGSVAPQADELYVDVPFAQASFNLLSTLNKNSGR